MVHKHWKVLKNQTLILILGHLKNTEKTCQIRSQKSYLGIQNGDMCFPGSWFVTLRCDEKKWWFLDTLPLAPQIRKICQIFVSGRVQCETNTTFGQRGPQGGTLFAHEELREKIQGKKRKGYKERRGKERRGMTKSYNIPSSISSRLYRRGMFQNSFATMALPRDWQHTRILYCQRGSLYVLRESIWDRPRSSMQNWLQLNWRWRRWNLRAEGAIKMGGASCEGSCIEW